MSPAEGASLPLPAAKRLHTGPQQDVSQSRPGHSPEALLPQSTRIAGDRELSQRRIQELGSPQLRQKQVTFHQETESLHCCAIFCSIPFSYQCIPKLAIPTYAPASFDELIMCRKSPNTKTSAQMTAVPECGHKGQCLISHATQPLKRPRLQTRQDPLLTCLQKCQPRQFPRQVLSWFS